VVEKQKHISFVNTFRIMVLGGGLTFFQLQKATQHARACHQLAVPAGCPRTLERHQADRASLPAVKTQQMQRTESDITKSGD